MEGHSKDPRKELEGTDELPILSEEAVLRFRLEAIDEERVVDSSLEASVESLRDTLDSAESRWRDLESKLEQQDRAIADLRVALGRPDRTVKVEKPQANDKGTERPEPAQQPEDRAASEQQALLERIAALETYIAGRADRWREMEHELNTKAMRIAELEAELGQRIQREQRLEDRLHDAGDHSQTLRTKVRQLSRLLVSERVLD